MDPIDKRILDVIAQHRLLHLAVSLDNVPWCCSCFYSYLPHRNMFVITSGRETRHIQDFLNGGEGPVAGTIALETKVTGKIRGIQFAGSLLKLKGDELKEARNHYLARFPVARLMKLHLWGIRPGILKLTDNRLGFGTKLLWRDSE